MNQRFRDAHGSGPTKPFEGIAKVSVNPDAAATESEQDEHVDLVEKVVEKAPPWLFSTAIHILLMVTLALCVSQIPPKIAREIILQPQVEIEDDEDLKFDVHVGDPEQQTTPILGSELDDQEENPTITPEPDPNADDPLKSEPESIDPLTHGPAQENPERVPIASLYEGRSETARTTAMLSGGGDETTEQAVLRGLRWLVRNQYRKGYWSLRGPYSDGAINVDNWHAATGMALLAFQGHGNTCERGEFRENVKAGWSWLLLQQQDDGAFYKPDSQTQEHLFYTHGICTIAICELYAMTQDPETKAKLKISAQKAIDYCVARQTKTGGWKYGRNDFQSDVSVTGWIVMALHSGRIAGLEVPQETLDRVTAFLDDVGEAGSKYPYEKDMDVNRCMTAEALLCRMFLGWNHDDERLAHGVNWLVEPENLVCFTRRDEMNRLNPRHTYYWYYATQTLHHFQGRQWKTWNDVMKQRVCENQNRTKGDRNEGSWDPYRPTRDAYAAEGGRLYVTCLSIYMLEVYYRHLPIYRINPDRR